MNIQIINGPNLNLLGIREPEIYGNESFDSFLERLRPSYPGIQLDYFQSNHEGQLIDKLQETGFSCHGIILNAGAFSHYSLAIADAMASITAPVIEVHLSNIHARESFREHSCTGRKAKGLITGLGLEGYRLAVDYFLNTR